MIKLGSALLMSMFISFFTTSNEHTLIGDSVILNQSDEDVFISPCTKFSDLDDKKGEEALEAFVVFRDFMKVEQYNEAYEYWLVAYQNAPAADGKRFTVYTEGVRLHEFLLHNTEDAGEKEIIISKILDLYEEGAKCFPPQEGYLLGLKAFDLYYKYPDHASDSAKYALFKRTINFYKEDSPVFVVNPFTALMIERFNDGKVEMEEAQNYSALLTAIIEKGVSSGKQVESWAMVANYSPARLESFESVEGFYDCDYYLDKYLNDFEENTSDCETAVTLLGRLKFAGCIDSLEIFTRLETSIDENCVRVATASTLAQDAFELLKEGKYHASIDALQLAVEEEDEIDKKAQYSLLIAKIYYGNLRDYPSSRKYARQAAKLNPNWGEPFFLIGKLYASSGPLCGPGTGWDSQIVTWVAIDKWIHARNIDPDIAPEVNKMIMKYLQYMPSVDDIFMRNLKVGQAFKVGCWIQESTTIRAAPK